MHTCPAVICFLACMRGRCTRRPLLASAGLTASRACHGLWVLPGCAAIDKRLGMLRMLWGGMLLSGTGRPGPGHGGPLTIHMCVRSIAVPSSYRRIMHGRIQIAARELQMAQQGI